MTHTFLHCCMLAQYQSARSRSAHMCMMGGSHRWRRVMGRGRYIIPYLLQFFVREVIIGGV